MKQEYIKKWLEGSLSEQEKKEFEKTEAFKSLQKLSDALQEFQAPEYETEAELTKLKAKRSRTQKGKTVRVNWMKPFLQVAAALVILVGAYVLFTQDSPTKMKTLASEKSELWLPDSSFVALNAHSTLAYSQENWENERQVILNGEAFFKVDKGTKFDVKTDAGTVSVLGTQFNVKQREGYFEVICYEGLVQVNSAQQSVKLQPNEMFRIIEGKVSQEREAYESSPAWMNGESSFKSVPFGFVIEEFERQYNVKVLSRNVDLKQLFTGRFTHSDQTMALQSIALPLNLTFETQGQEVILSPQQD
jgi:transmembrane sensor